MKKKSNNSNLILIMAVLIVLVGVGTFIGVTQFAVTGTQDALQTGKYISVPTYGFLKCEEAQSSVRNPTIGDWYSFDYKIIKCQDSGSLVDGCTITLKSPSQSMDVSANAYIGYSVRNIGSSCDGAFDNIMWVKKFGTTLNQEGYDAEVNVPITSNQYICAGYLEGGLIDLNPSNNLANKGRYSITYRPYFIYRYDVFSQSNGAVVPNTEDCTRAGEIEETNFLIEDVLGDGKLSSQLQESQLLDLNNMRSAGARVSYLSNFVPIVPQYDLFNEEGYTRYCYDKKIYNVEEVVTAGGSYLVANTGTNKEVKSVQCCNNGDVPSGYKCVDFKTIPLSSGEDSCSVLKPCPIVGYLPVAGKKVASQECVSGTCVTSYTNVECNFDAECYGGYCDVDTLNPSNNECVNRDPVDYCGNGVCEASRGEDEFTCSKDCSPLPSSNNNWIYFLLGGALLVLLFAIYQRKKNGDNFVRQVGF